MNYMPFWFIVYDLRARLREFYVTQMILAHIGRQKSSIIFYTYPANSLTFDIAKLTLSSRYFKFLQVGRILRN